jgi:hypothetical protein
MPRVFDSANEPFDYCRYCSPSERVAEELHKFPVLPTANDGRGCCFSVGCEHPPYDEWDYKCAKCGDTLGESDY